MKTRSATSVGWQMAILVFALVAAPVPARAQSEKVVDIVGKIEGSGEEDSFASAKSTGIGWIELGENGSRQPALGRRCAGRRLLRRLLVLRRAEDRIRRSPDDIEFGGFVSHAAHIRWLWHRLRRR